MALALKYYQTITGVVGLNTVGIYTAPTGYSAIVLLAQATNIGSDTQTINFSHERTTSGIAVTTEMLEDFQFLPMMPPIFWLVNMFWNLVILWLYHPVVLLT